MSDILQLEQRVQVKSNDRFNGLFGFVEERINAPGQLEYSVWVETDPVEACGEYALFGRADLEASEAPVPQETGYRMLGGR